MMGFGMDGNMLAGASIWQRATEHGPAACLSGFVPRRRLVALSVALSGLVLAVASSAYFRPSGSVGRQGTPYTKGVVIGTQDGLVRAGSARVSTVVHQVDELNRPASREFGTNNATADDWARITLHESPASGWSEREGDLSERERPVGPTLEGPSRGAAVQEQEGFDRQAQESFFERRIRPVLIEYCLPCHSDTDRESGLSLESRAGWADRDVIAPGFPSESLLMERVLSESEDERMPPSDHASGPLSRQQILDLEEWIRRGAYDPRLETASVSGPLLRTREFKFTERDLGHWAYQPRNGLPVRRQVAAGESLSAGIDRYLYLNQQSQGLYLLPLATPRERVRRAYFDLWGLPPEPGAVEAFEREPTPSAWDELIDRLLASKHYGERWGRYWLDSVRYAETNGYERDGVKLEAWRYRDYVIRALNEDKSYQQFLVEQLAGDLWAQEEGITPETNEKAWRDAIIATGFYRLHVWDDEPDSSVAAEYDDLDDILNTIGTTFLGLTISCARCHDHKFDPFQQVDYYAMLDFLRDIDPYGLPKQGGGGRGTGRIHRYLVSDRAVQEWQDRQRQAIVVQQQIIESRSGDDVKAAAQAELNRLSVEQPPFERALCIMPPVGERPITHVLNRGDPASPGATVSAATPSLFERLKVPAKLERSDDSESAPQDRLGLARWMTKPDHPLTARVIVNRLWLGHFGQGLVPTPDDFGFTGIEPFDTHVLDALADELVSSQWSLKHIHRIIMRTRTYQATSTLSSGSAQRNRAKDPGNLWFWRQNLRRLDAEAIRDSILYYANALHPKDHGPSVYPALLPEIRATANPVSVDSWHESPAEIQGCRSVFLVVKRSLKDPLLEAFDFANSHSPTGIRPTTIVAPQALMLLNDRFVAENAGRLAEQITSRVDSTRDRVDALWSVVFQRSPTESEALMVDRFLEGSTPEVSEVVRWARIARAILNSNEAIFID